MGRGMVPRSCPLAQEHPPVRSGDCLEALDDAMRRVASISCRMTQVMPRWQRLGAGYARVMSHVTSVKMGRSRGAMPAGTPALPDTRVGGRECWDG